MSNVKRIQIIPSQIDRPASQEGVTLTGTYSNLPYNKNAIKRLQAIVGDNFEGDLNIFDNEEGAFKILPLERIQQLLTQVLIRFDNDPSYYTKSDYQYLIWYLCQSLGYLDSNCISKEEFLDVSSKLKEAIDWIQQQLDGSISDLNQRITTVELELRDSISKLKEEITHLCDDINAKLDSIKIEIFGGSDINISNDTIDISLDEDILVQYATVGNVTHGDVIKQGSSLTEVLKRLLQKVIDVRVKTHPSVKIKQQNNLIPYGGSLNTKLDYTFSGIQFEPEDSIWKDYAQPVTQIIKSDQIQWKDRYSETIFPNGEISIPSFTKELTINIEVPYFSEGRPTKSNEEVSDVIWEREGVVTDNITFKPYYEVFLGSIVLSEKPGDLVDEFMSGSLPGSELLDIKLYQQSHRDTNKYSSTESFPALYIACPSIYKLSYLEDPAIPNKNIIDQFEKYICPRSCGSEPVEYTVYLNPAISGTVNVTNLKFERV